MTTRAPAVLTKLRLFSSTTKLHVLFEFKRTVCMSGANKGRTSAKSAASRAWEEDGRQFVFSYSLSNLIMSSKGPEVHGDVKGLVESGDHVAEHGLEGGVVGAVRHVQDGRHLPRRVRLHLLEQGLQVDALKGRLNHVLTLNECR